jgi:hypothetical protein
MTLNWLQALVALIVHKQKFNYYNAQLYASENQY